SRGTDFVSSPVPVLGVIPARLGSSRLPRKPLRLLAGEPLVLHVVRRLTELAVCDRVVVATDADEIAAVARGGGFEAVLTSPRHQSGTERIAEVIAKKDYTGYDLILNVQVDEPLVAAAALQGTLERVRRGDPIGTAAGTLEPREAGDPNRVKVVVGAGGHAVYFSRAPIPFDRDGTGQVAYRQHVGVYGYTRYALERWVRLPPVPAERWEGLEQLRPLLHGIPIGVALFDEAPAPGVDTAADLQWAEEALARQPREVSP
ncbi:MAG: 3-deoxy-manno-octulosonate cytidylyltransferase, partial [Gemmatimonadales bacterium]